MPVPNDDDDRALRGYAAVGDGRTVALISRSGSVDWLPIPDLNSTPVFARLLDAESGGCIQLAPVSEYTVRRRYVSGTNVLRSTYTTSTGSVAVTDALVTGVAGRLPWAEFARRVEGIRGSVRMEWAVIPGTCLGTVSPWVQQLDGTAIIRAGGVTIGVTGSDHHPSNDDDPESTRQFAGRFTAKAGSRHVLAVVATKNEPLHLPDPSTVDAGVDRTIRNWREWSRASTWDGPWSAQVQRSVLALKLLIYAPTGAIAAAATTSLPESTEGGKNWDYRFAWVRDVAYTVRALNRFGLREETHAALSWLLKTITSNGPELHIFYGLDGDVPSGVQTYAVPGWNGIGPVIAGNRAQDQLQLGIFGDLLGVAREYVEGGNLLDADTGRLLESVADRVCDEWRSPDSGMWELPDVAQFTSSKMGCWQALEAAITLADRGQLSGNTARWMAERDAIRDWVSRECWSESLHAYVMEPGSTRLDASVLLHAPSGFDRGERMSSTIDAIRSHLGRGPLVFRYTGIEEQEHPFVACSFWVASALACVGRLEEAVALMDELVGLSNDVGLLSEMIAVDDGAFWGNLPQGLSHLALINAAITIEEMGSQE